MVDVLMWAAVVWVGMWTVTVMAVSYVVVMTNGDLLQNGAKALLRYIGRMFFTWPYDLCWVAKYIWDSPM